MSSNDTNYYRQRAVDERAMALAADRQNVRSMPVPETSGNSDKRVHRI